MLRRLSVVKSFFFLFFRYHIFTFVVYLVHCFPIHSCSYAFRNHSLCKWVLIMSNLDSSFQNLECILYLLLNLKTGGLLTGFSKTWFFIKFFIKYSWYTILLTLVSGVQYINSTFLYLTCDHPNNSSNHLSSCKLITILLTTCDFFFFFFWKTFLVSKFKE